MSAKDVLKFIKDKEAEFVDLRFTDPRGKLQHLTMDSTIVDDEMLKDGVFFDNVNKDYVLIVESIGDALSCIENGITNVLVSFGLDLSSKLICSIISFNFKKIILSFNNDSNKENNAGMNASVKNYLKLINYYDKNNIKICLPLKNDFGDMNSDDFSKWKEKLNVIESTNQLPKIKSFAKKLSQSKGISKNLIKNLKILHEEA